MKSVIVLAATAVLVAAPAANAMTPRTRIAHLNRQVHQLRARLHEERAADAAIRTLLEQAQSQLAAAQTQVSTLTSQSAGLQTQLVERTRERDAARAQAGALQAEIAAIPTPTTVAVEQVRREVAYSESVLDTAGVPYSHAQLVAQSALTYVVGHVSAPAYGYMHTMLGTIPAATPDSVLGNQAGICGDAALTYAAIVKRFGFDVRSVQFYYGPGGAWNHIADEVSYDGSWHYFDPTFGLYYQQSGIVLSIADARAATGPELVKDASLLWTTVTTQAGNTELSDTGFATDPATDVVIDGQPFVG